MKLALWIGFLIIFLWLFSVVAAIANPSAFFNSLIILTAVIGAVIIFFIVESVR